MGDIDRDLVSSWFSEDVIVRTAAFHFNYVVVPECKDDSRWKITTSPLLSIFFWGTFGSVKSLT